MCHRDLLGDKPLEVAIQQEQGTVRVESGDTGRASGRVDTVHQQRDYTVREREGFDLEREETDQQLEGTGTGQHQRAMGID